MAMNYSEAYNIISYLSLGGDPRLFTNRQIHEAETLYWRVRSGVDISHCPRYELEQE